MLFAESSILVVIAFSAAPPWYGENLNPASSYGLCEAVKFITPFISSLEFAR